MSLQLLPISRMVFSLCSSAGLHGVFVRLFLAGGCAKEEPASSSSISGIAPDTDRDGPAIEEAVTAWPEMRRLRDAAGLSVATLGATGADEVENVAPGDER